MQYSSKILMIRPVRFNFNPETAVNNRFQSKSGNAVEQKALEEFDGFVHLLQNNRLDPVVVNDTPEPFTPDSVFPNNWISFHEDGTLVLYPMFAENRRKERKQEVLNRIKALFQIKQTIDLTAYEKRHRFLEGTGSMVLDRENNIAYACISERTDKELLSVFCEKMRYAPVSFTATDAAGAPIYHTNVMMCIADRFAVVCLDSIRHEAERKMVQTTIEKTGKQLVPISIYQMNHFAGNMLQVANSEGEKLLVMSSQAFQSLTSEQIRILEQYNRIIHSDISTIEANGGGSARCMIAEIFLPVN
jgi:hypothetical protein